MTKPTMATSPAEAQDSTRSTDRMAPTWRPAEVEPAVYARWVAADVFAPDGVGSRAAATAEPFVIIQPPPNATGALHLGHAARTATEDLMIRRARMQGRPTLWLPGVDHASIAAQFVLDGILAQRGESRESLGREAYLERMRDFVQQTRGVITRQQKRLGASADWRRERFTMDAGSAKAVRTAFKRLYDDGLAYSGERLINWCPGCGTSLSDLEVIPTPQTGTLWFVRYHVLRDGGDPGDESITVATTRPETILGDTAVAVHPDDERYHHLVGRTVRIPFVNRPVPVIADDAVDPDFGTGAVKVTPGHDHNDFAIGQRHGLPIVDVMTDAGRINDNGDGYAGLTLSEARVRVLEDLRAEGDLVEERAHEMVIGRCQRSDDVVEPRLKTQWFINVKPMAERAMAAVRQGRTRIVPPRFEKVFFDWMENIHDWNVSRQLWWGHRIPAWYCPDGHITVSDQEEGPSACAVCGRPASDLRQDEDIFDTWFSSGLWPFSTLGWPDSTEDLRRFYPGSVMETGYDILFFWVARMMMLGEWLTGGEPFRSVYLSGLIRDPYGRKMSKTRGNVIDPLGVIDEIGADALRFALINGTAPGADQRLGPSRLEGARNFANKIWNAARFVEGARPAELHTNAPLSLPDAGAMGPAEHWILDRCAATLREADEAYATFQFGDAMRVLQAAIWNEYCDWYLELAKVQLASEMPVERRIGTWKVLSWVLERYLRVLHPVMPHLTEEIWGRLPREPNGAELLVVTRWPDPDEPARSVDQDLAAGVADLITLVTAIRNARSDAGIDPATWLAAAIVVPTDAARRAFPALEAGIGRLARVRPTLAPSRELLDEIAGGVAVVTPVGEARLSSTGADRSRELERIARERTEAERLLASTRERLADARFIERAPAEVVEGARRRAAELEARIARLTQHLGGP
jgi:valyl-tRNA synthetase